MLQVGSGSVEKVPDPAGQKSPDPDPHPWVHEDDMLSSATPPGLLISRSVCDRIIDRTYLTASGLPEGPHGSRFHRDAHRAGRKVC